ncbi:MAG TPA: DUF4249 family protein [Flavobacteriaceae bacterium]|nr:DUF4249 family protein [Flavobacteriaceae bacterium]
MRLFLILTTFFFLLGCEEVIDLELNEMAPKLVVDASINILKEDGAPYESRVLLTTTGGFYDESETPILDALVLIRSENETVEFHHSENGKYVADFTPQPGIEYKLIIIYEGETYSATTKLVTTSSIEHIEQRNDGGFFGDQIELKAYFLDPGDQENYYYTVTESVHGVRRDVLSDQFFNGNSIFSYYSHKNLSGGDVVYFHLFGVNESFFNYMNLLLEQTGSGGPFGTHPSTVRGNIVNENTPENFAFGYFRISEVSVKSYVVE